MNIDESNEINHNTDINSDEIKLIENSTQDLIQINTAYQNELSPEQIEFKKNDMVLESDENSSSTNPTVESTYSPNNINEENKNSLNIEESEGVEDEEHFYKPTYILEDFLPDSRSEIKDWTCQLCKGIFYFPLATSCGHTFCKDCINKYISLNSNCCPIDGKMISSELIDIVLVRSILERHDIYCTNKKKGCDWIGKYKEQPFHKQKDCPKEFISCSFEGCTVKIMREVENSHKENCNFKTTQCEFCNNVVIQHKYDSHLKECDRMPVNCSQCSKNILREDVDKHLLSDCEEQEINCSYSKFGCEFKVKRKELDYHCKQSLNEHTLLMGKTIQNLEDGLESRLEGVVEKIVNNNLKRIYR